MAAAADVSHQAAYIQHNLVHFNSLGEKQTAITNFGVINFDSMFWSFLMGLTAVGLMWFAARKATSGVPGRFQGFIEMLVDMVDQQARSIIPSEETRRLVAPQAMTVFMWIVLMNALDLIPVDLAHYVFHLMGIGINSTDPLHFHRILPTADLNVPMGMSMGVLLLMLYYGLKIKTPAGFVKELFTAPFHAHGFAAVLLAPANLFLNLVEYAAKSVSLGMRLFGNMFAGELVFMLIALLGGAWTGFNSMSMSLGIAHILAGSVWAIFHILIVLLQAFIFMMLTLVYIGQAHDAH